MDMTRPIPARHDQPRHRPDWSIDHMLRGSDLSPLERRRSARSITRPTYDSGEGESVLSTESNTTRYPRLERRRSARATRPTFDSGDGESVLSTHSNVRHPRPEVSLYQSQVDDALFGSLSGDTPSGHYSNQSPTDVALISDEPSSSARLNASAAGVFDNFILVGPGIKTPATDSGRRRTEDERPSQRSRLEQLFDDRPSSSDVAPTHGLDSDVTETRLQHISEHISEDGSADNSLELPSNNNARTNSFGVTTGSVLQ